MRIVYTLTDYSTNETYFFFHFSEMMQFLEYEYDVKFSSLDSKRLYEYEEDVALWTERDFNEAELDDALDRLDTEINNIVSPYILNRTVEVETATYYQIFKHYGFELVSLITAGDTTKALEVLDNYNAFVSTLCYELKTIDEPEE